MAKQKQLTIPRCHWVTIPKADRLPGKPTKAFVPGCDAAAYRGADNCSCPPMDICQMTPEEMAKEIMDLRRQAKESQVRSDRLWKKQEKAIRRGECMFCGGPVDGAGKHKPEANGASS